MKKLICICILMFPIIGFAQQPWDQYSPIDYAWKHVGNAQFSPCFGAPNLVFSPSGEPCVAFEDGSTAQATVMKFDGLNWVYVGLPKFTQDAADCLSLAIDPLNGEPYVAYMDWGSSGLRTSVMKFDGSNWVYVGSQFFSAAGQTVAQSIAFSPADNMPYVAFEDGGWGYNARVMKYNGTDWVNVGIPGFSTNGADWTSLAFSPSDSLPYVAFSSNCSSGSMKATVMKFNGTDWVYVGNPCFSPNGAYWTRLVFSPSNHQPYVSFGDSTNTGKATVMTFNGTSWELVGNKGFSGGPAGPISLAIKPNGTPYVAYMDYSLFKTASVMKFDGANWVYEGNPSISQDEIYWTSLAISQSGQPFVAYNNTVNNSRISVLKYDSVTVGINKVKESNLSVYPNPANDKITIEIPEGQTPGQLSMINLNGEVVLMYSLIKPKTQIDISNLRGDVYFMRLTSKFKVCVEKFVKQ